MLTQIEVVKLHTEAIQCSLDEITILRMEKEEDWGIKPIRYHNIYELEAAIGLIRQQGRNRNRGRENDARVANKVYDDLSNRHCITAEGGAMSRDSYFQNMNELNYPADEQFRKESQITKNRVERDRTMKIKRLVIVDVSTDEFVIPCRFPHAIDLKEKNEETPIMPSSFNKIEEFLKLPRPNQRWADAMGDRVESIEDLIITRAVEAAAKLEGNESSICFSFEDHPPSFDPRDKRNPKLLRTIVIDGCAMMKQVNFSFEVPWNPTGGATNIFKGNKMLVMKPLIELTMRFLLQGHRTVIILPTYYMNPVFAGVRQKVDNLDAFNVLVATGLVQFIEEDTLVEMHHKLFEANEKLEGTWVSTCDIERIVESYNRNVDNNRHRVEDGTAKKIEMAKFTRRLTPFFFDNKLVLPLHMSTEQKKLLFSDTLMEVDIGDISDVVKIAEFSENQLTMEEQRRILSRLQNLFDLPMRLLRGMMLYRRILKEIDENEEEKKALEDVAAIQDLDEDVRRAFAIDPI